MGASEGLFLRFVFLTSLFHGVYFLYQNGIFANVLPTLAPTASPFGVKLNDADLLVLRWFFQILAVLELSFAVAAGYSVGFAAQGDRKGILRAIPIFSGTVIYFVVTNPSIWAEWVWLVVISANIIKVAGALLFSLSTI